MGSQIAAHLANVGLTCDLLDAIPGAAGEGESAAGRRRALSLTAAAFDEIRAG